jgi:hypothetical protein
MNFHCHGNLVLMVYILFVSADVCDMQSWSRVNVSKLALRLKNASYIKKRSEVPTAVSRLWAAVM